MSTITFGKGVPAFGRAAAGGFGRKGDSGRDNQANGGAGAGKQDGVLDTARTVLEAAKDLRDEATAEICLRVIEASTTGRQPSSSDLRVINNYFK